MHPAPRARIAEWAAWWGGWFGVSRKVPRLDLRELLAERSLEQVYQPVVDLTTGAIVGQEALVRTPRKLAQTNFDALLEAAHLEQCLDDLELACFELAIDQWMTHKGKGLLFVNVSAQTLMQLQAVHANDKLMKLLAKYGMSAAQLGLDLSGYSHLDQLDALVKALQPLRQAGVTIALDNFDAHASSMEAWARILPDIVKLSPRWTHNIAHNHEQRRVVLSMVHLAQRHRMRLVVKSVETDAELLHMKTLGVGFAQGFFLGGPSDAPLLSLNPRACDVLAPSSERV
ncbi:MAG: EAL domain-containing protein [Rhodoferax sp.]|nr:EAL domain-containing protein [Rhodoferax sp.]